MTGYVRCHVTREAVVATDGKAIEFSIERMARSFPDWKFLVVEPPGPRDRMIYRLTMGDDARIPLSLIGDP